MPGEDQERFEDYLELEHYIEDLQAGSVAHLPAELTSDQARIYRMAALFRSASPTAAEPRPEFAAQLQARLEQELQYSQSEQPTLPLPIPIQRSPVPPVPQVPVKQEKAPNPSHPRRNVSRRSLLTGGAAVAASLIAGAGIERTVEQVLDNRSVTGSASPTASPSPTYPLFLIGTDVSTASHFVATLDQLGNGAIRFTTDTVVGYVIHDDDSNDPNALVAISAACTHRGCIVQWQNSDRKFHCPCHGGLFTEYGGIDAGAAPIQYLTPLPRLNAYVQDGKIYVDVPVK